MPDYCARSARVTGGYGFSRYIRRAALRVALCAYIYDCYFCARVSNAFGDIPDFFTFGIHCGYCVNTAHYALLYFSYGDCRGGIG